MCEIGQRTPTYTAQVPFGTTIRRELWRNLPTTVGPGQYDPKSNPRSQLATAAFSLSSDRKYFIDTEAVPSPAAYSQLAPWGSDRPPRPGTRSTSIKPREAFPLREAGRLPGPSDYSPIIEH
jgi:hypothetical protein